MKKKIFHLFFLLSLIFSPGFSQANEEIRSLEKIQSLLAHNNKAAALPLLNQLVEQKTKLVEAYLYLGVLQREQKNLDQAIATFEQGLRIKPQHLPTQLELAMSYAWQQQWTQSINIYDQILAKDPNHQAAILGKARVLGWMGQAQQSIYLYQDFLKNQDPQSIEALRGLGTAYRSHMKFKQAKVYYHKALEIDPADQESKNGLALLEKNKKGTLSANLGIVYFDENPSRTSGTGDLDLSYQWNSKIKSLFSYRVDLPSGLGNSIGENQSDISQAIKALIAYQVSPRFNFSGGYELFLQDNTSHRLIVRPSYKISPSLIILGGTQVGFSTSGRVDGLFDLGLQYIINEKFWIMGQGFYFRDNQGQSNWTLVATTSAQAHPRLALKGVLGTSIANNNKTLITGLELSTPLSKNSDFRINYQLLSGGINRHAASAGITFRF